MVSERENSAGRTSSPGKCTEEVPHSGSASGERSPSKAARCVLANKNASAGREAGPDSL